MLAGYLLGSLPFGFLLSKMRGIDIRSVGSCNIGATNVFRSVSKPLGILTFFLDFLKGLCGVMVIPALMVALLGVAMPGKGFALVCGVAAVAGHNWSCFLGFKGGKGVATSAGLLMGLTPQGVGLAFMVWLVMFLTTRYVSVASILASMTLGVVVWWPLRLEVHGFWFPFTLSSLAALVVWKHRANMVRLYQGCESRFTFRRG